MAGAVMLGAEAAEARSVPLILAVEMGSSVRAGALGGARAPSGSAKPQRSWRERPKPKADPEEQSWSPPRRHGPAYHHGGFYLRMAAGPAYFSDGIDSNQAGESSLTGASTTGEVMVGGTVFRSTALGIGVQYTRVLAPSFEGEGANGQTPREVSLLVMGPFYDWYFNPLGGWHVQFMWGVALLRPDVVEDVSTSTCLTLGLGREWFFAPEWSFGLLGRLTVAALEHRKTRDLGGGREAVELQERHWVTVPALIGTMTFH